MNSKDRGTSTTARPSRNTTEKKGRPKARIEKRPDEEYLGIKIIKKINIPDFLKRYRIYLRITGDLSQFKVPQFLSSILSMGKIPIGSVELGSKKNQPNRYEFHIDFTPSSVLSILTKHERFSYRSHVFFDKKNGFVTQKTFFLERKTDGREFIKEEDFSKSKGSKASIEKDPIAFFLDLISSDISSLINKPNNEEQDELLVNPFDVRFEDKNIRIKPKTSEFGELFSSVEVELSRLSDDFKIPSKFVVKGLFSLLDVIAESE